jgi:hypothetical protein
MKVKEVFDNITFPITLYDKNKNVIYHEEENGQFIIMIYDSSNRLIYQEMSSGYFKECEYDNEGNLIYFKNPNGIKFDNRPDFKKKFKIKTYSIKNNSNEGLTARDPNLQNGEHREVQLEDLFIEIPDPILFYDKQENKIYYQDKKGFYWKSEYDENSNQVYYNDKYNRWWKKEYDSQSRVIKEVTPTGEQYYEYDN